MLRTGRTLVKIFVIKDNRMWSTLVKIRDVYPDFTSSTMININYDVDICSHHYCDKNYVSSMSGIYEDSDTFDPYDVKEMFSGYEEFIKINDREHAAIDQNFLNSKTYANDIYQSEKCAGDARFCRLKYNQATFAGTHNSASGADERFKTNDFTERCNVADQTSSLEKQLESGIRYFEFNPCATGCPIYEFKRVARSRMSYSVFRSYQSPFTRKNRTRIQNKMPQFKDWPGLCTKGRCSMPLCRAVKVLKRWNSINPTEVLTITFGTASPGSKDFMEENSWDTYLDYIGRFLDRQLGSNLNRHRLHHGDWPYIGTRQAVFIFINDNVIDPMHEVFERYSWIHRQSQFLVSTHMIRGVTGSCKHVVSDSGLQCRLKPNQELLSLIMCLN